MGPFSIEHAFYRWEAPRLACIGPGPGPPDGHEDGSRGTLSLSGGRSGGGMEPRRRDIVGAGLLVLALIGTVVLIVALTWGGAA